MLGKRNRTLTFIVIIGIILGISSGAFGFTWKDISDKVKLPNLPKVTTPILPGSENVRVLKEENLVIDVVDRVSPSVVTVGISTTRNTARVFEIDPFDPFNIFRQNPGSREQKTEQDIGS